MKIPLSDGREIDTDEIPAVEASEFGFRVTTDSNVELYFFQDERVVARVGIPRKDVRKWFGAVAAFAVRLKIPPFPQSQSRKSGH